MGSPDILFLVLDSVRADRVSAYGHNRRTTPVLDRFCEQATRFEHAFVPAPWTLPSHTSMFTGLAPSEHGVHTWFKDQPKRIPSELTTIAEALSDRGYLTAGFSNNPWVGSLTGLDRGFDEFVEWDLEISSTADPSMHGVRGRTYSALHSVLGTANRQPLFLLKRRFFTSRLIDRATTWLKQNHGPPTFTFLNLMEAHSPYFPRRSDFSRLGLKTPGPIEPRVLNTKLLAYTLGRRDLSKEECDRVLEYYDASLRYQDRKVATLLETLKETDQFDGTLIVICSDHGKTLGEYDREASVPHYLQWVNTNVPLLVKAPYQGQAKRVSAPVELSRIHELLHTGGTSPVATLSGDGYAMVEEHVPHTGRTATDPVTWRGLMDGEYRLLRREDGVEFLIHEGEQLDGEQSLKEWLSAALDSRIESLQSMDSQQATAGTELGASVERQLGDLGYLE